MTPFSRSYYSYMTFNSNSGSILHRFWHIWFGKITAILKSGSGVTQCHRYWYPSVACLWFPINVPLPWWDNQPHRDLDTRDMGHLRSLQMTPFDRPHMTLCLRSVVTLVLACTEISCDIAANLNYNHVRHLWKHRAVYLGIVRLKSVCCSSARFQNYH